VEGVDVAPVFQVLIRLTVLDSLLEGLGINGIAQQRGQGGVGRTIGVEQALPRRNEGGDTRADAPAEGPEPFFIDVAGFATLDGEELVVHRDHIIQEGFLHLDEETEHQGVASGGREAAQGADIIASGEPCQVLHNPRTHVTEIELGQPQVTDHVITVDIRFESRRGGFGGILLQRREGGLRLARARL
jgi:hypothetical protein